MTEVWIPGAAWDHIEELRMEAPEEPEYAGLDSVEVIRSRRRGTGRQVLVPAVEPLARLFENEAAFWDHPAMEPDARRKGRPCRIAAERIREALK
jgi:hypothetical protein